MKVFDGGQVMIVLQGLPVTRVAAQMCTESCLLSHERLFGDACQILWRVRNLPAKVLRPNAVQT